LVRKGIIKGFKLAWNGGYSREERNSLFIRIKGRVGKERFQIYGFNSIREHWQGINLT